MAKLITIATYWNPTEARLAHIYLKDAGIHSVLQNENTVTMNWMEIANASRGIQLEVAENDVDAAVDVLQTTGSGADSEWEETTLAEFAEDETTNSTDTAPAATVDVGIEDKEEPLNHREQTIERAMKSAMYGLIVLPLVFYAAYLIGVSLLSHAPLRPKSRKTARKAMLTCGLTLLAYFLFASQVCGYGPLTEYTFYEFLFGQLDETPSAARLSSIVFT